MIDPLQVAPGDDSGADTQDRYRWQHHCTAVDCLAMLRDSRIRRIVCEIHEDYVVDRGDSDTELVSCKTRELSRGPWSLGDLCLTGGLAHLFSRARSLPGEVRLRLLTNAGLKPGPREAAAVVHACRELADGADCNKQIAEHRDVFGWSLLAAGRRRPFMHIPVVPAPSRGVRPPLPLDFADQVEHFMRTLRVCDSLPSRSHIRGHHLEEVMRPALVAMDRDPSGAGTCYDSLLSLVATRNATGPLTGQYASWITDRRVGTARGTLAALVQARTIARNDVLAALDTQKASEAVRVRTVTGRDRLRIKLMAGGVGETRINSAQRLRERWLAHWNATRNDLPGDQRELGYLEDLILDLAGDAEAAVASDGSDWGDKMYEMLRSRLQSVISSPLASIAPTGELLFGLALSLAADCEIWFSKPFDIEAVLRESMSRASALSETRKVQ